MKRSLRLAGLVFALVAMRIPLAIGHEDEPHAVTTAESHEDASTTHSAAVESSAGEHEHQDHVHPGDTEAGHGAAEDHHSGEAHARVEAETAAHGESDHDHAQAEHKAEREAGASPHPEAEHHAHADGQEHDHATDHGQPTSTEGRVIAFLGKFHPVAIHFPIALILFAVALEGLGFATDRSGLHDAAYFCLLAGALSAVVAAALGWAAGSGARFPQEIGGVSVLWLHRWMGVSTAGLAILTAAAGWISRKRTGGNSGTVYRFLLVVTAVVVGVTGHFGAALVFGLDHFTL